MGCHKPLIKPAISVGGFVKGEPNPRQLPLKTTGFTLPETNSSPMKAPLFPGKYHQKGGFSMAMLVLGRVAMFFSNQMSLGLCIYTFKTDRKLSSNQMINRK